MRVIGIGNALRGDDAAGLLVARRVRDLDEPGVEVVMLEGEPTRLIDAWDDVQSAVVVDAARSGAAGGSVQRFDAAAEPLPAAVSASSSHALGLGEAIEIARALRRLPARLIVYALEGERFEAGSPVSASVAAAVEPTARAVLREYRG
jgi:hydrogenase maturation protease